MRKTKKLLSLFLTLTMLLSMMAVPVAASESDTAVSVNNLDEQEGEEESPAKYNVVVANEEDTKTENGNETGEETADIVWEDGMVISSELTLDGSEYTAENPLQVKVNGAVTIDAKVTLKGYVRIFGAVDGAVLNRGENLASVMMYAWGSDGKETFTFEDLKMDGKNIKPGSDVKNLFDLNRVNVNITRCNIVDFISKKNSAIMQFDGMDGCIITYTDCVLDNAPNAPLILMSSSLGVTKLIVNGCTFNVGNNTAIRAMNYNEVILGTGNKFLCKVHQRNATIATQKTDLICTDPDLVYEGLYAKNYTTFGYLVWDGTESKWIWSETAPESALTVSASVTGEGSGSVPNFTSNKAYDIYKEGETVTFKVSALANSYVESVTYQPEGGEAVTLTKGEDGNYSFIMPNASVSITATLRLKETYAITVGEVQNGTLKTNITSGYEGQTVQITDTPDDGYLLKSVSYQVNGEGEKIAVTDTVQVYENKAWVKKWKLVMPAAPVTLYAEFYKESMKLTVAATDNGIKLTLEGQKIPEAAEGSLYVTEAGVVTVDASSAEFTAKNELRVELNNITLASLATDENVAGGVQIITPIGGIKLTQAEVTALYKAAGTKDIALVLTASGEVNAAEVSGNVLIGTAQCYALSIEADGGMLVSAGLTAAISLPFTSEAELWQCSGAATLQKINYTSNDDWVDFSASYPAKYLFGSLTQGRNVPAVDENGYYQVTTADELLWTVNHALYGNIKLMNDIEISATTVTDWRPFSNFYGRFDGNGHTISGTICTEGQAGLFRKATNAYIENLTVAGKLTATNIDSGVIVGEAIGCTIKNCVSKSSFSVTTNSTGMGGIVGAVTGAGAVTTISDCANYTNIVSGRVGSGGIIGMVYSDGSAVVENCINKAEIGFSGAGGIVGSMSGQKLTVNGCANNGTVSADGNSGGILGAVSAGIVEISNCYNTADIYGNRGNGGITGYCGGILARVTEPAKITSITVTNCYNVGNLSSHRLGTLGDYDSDVEGYNLGQIVDLHENKVTVTNCYYKEITPVGEDGVTEPEYGISKTSDELKALAETLGEAYTSDNANDPLAFGYPILKWQSTGSSAVGWYGDGTAIEYIISSADEMVEFAQIVNGTHETIAKDTFKGKTVKLASNIDLTGIDWKAVGGTSENVALTITSQEELQAAINEHNLIYDNKGNSYKAGTDKNMTYVEGYSYYYVTGNIFSGTFDGAGYKIDNLNVNTDTGYAGLFGNVNGTIKDLTVSGTVTSSTKTDFVGGIAGKLSEGGTIKNVTSNVTVSAVSCYNVGGIAGFVGTKGAMTSADNTFVIECVNNGDVTGYSQIGGITGENAGQIIRCANNGKIDGTKTSSKNGTAGIAGRNGCNNAADSKGTIIDCYNTGVIGNSQMKWVGGIAGLNNSNSLVKNCYNVGKVNGIGQANGLVGQNEGSKSSNGGVYNCWYLDTLKVFDESGVYGGYFTDCGMKTESEMKSDIFAAILGENYNVDSDNINNGYPVLKWQGGSAAPSIYNVTLPAGSTADGYLTTTEDSTVVAAGGTFSFSVALVDTSSTVVVTANDEPLTAVDGVYTINNINADVTVVITVSTSSGGADENISISIGNGSAKGTTVDGVTTFKAGTAESAPTVTVTAPENGWAVGENTFTVSADKACTVIVKNADGTYTKLAATAVSDAENTYSFTTSESFDADCEIIVSMTGDINGDGTISQADYLSVLSAIRGASLEGPAALRADVNSDDSISQVDYLSILSAIRGASLSW